MQSGNIVYILKNEKKIWYTYLRTNKKPLRRADDGECNICMVEERGYYEVFECPGVGTLDGAQSWEDLEDEVKVGEGEWSVKSFLGKITTSKGWG